MTGCFRPYKYTNFKAIHNRGAYYDNDYFVVFDPTNIQILKQFTTVVNSIASGNGCVRPYNYTNFKAIHNVRQCFT